MSVQEMLQWWNLVYLAPLLVSLVWILATVLGGLHGSGSHDLGHGAVHSGHDLGHGIAHGDHGHDLAHDAAHGHGTGHSHGNTSHDHDMQSSERSFAGHIVWLLGLEQVPVTLLVGVFLLCWGTFGMMSNHLFQGILKYPAIYIGPSMGVTFVLSAVVTRTMASLVSRYLPSEENYAVARVELIGCIGKAVYEVSGGAGTVNLSDKYGTVHRVMAKTEDSTGSISPGTEVIAVDFDEKDNRFIVRQYML